MIEKFYVVLFCCICMLCKIIVPEVLVLIEVKYVKLRLVYHLAMGIKVDHFLILSILLES